MEDQRARQLARTMKEKERKAARTIGVQPRQMGGQGGWGREEDPVHRELRGSPPAPHA